MYFSTCGLILSSTIVESVFRMVFSSVIGRRFFGGPFGFPGFGNGLIALSEAYYPLCFYLHGLADILSLLVWYIRFTKARERGLPLVLSYFYGTKTQFGMNARASTETERLPCLHHRPGLHTQSPPPKLCVDDESLDPLGWCHGGRTPDLESGPYNSYKLQDGAELWVMNCNNRCSKGSSDKYLSL